MVDGQRSVTVDILNRSCSCLFWQLEEIPCGHAVAALWMGKLDPMNYMSSYYTKETLMATYSRCVYPVNENQASLVRAGDTSVIKPPKLKTLPGRPRKKRIRSSNEFKHVHCGSCGEAGHNTRTCAKI